MSETNLHIRRPPSLPELPEGVDKACGYLDGTVVSDSCSSHVLLGEKSKFTQTALLLCMLGSSQQ